MKRSNSLRSRERRRDLFARHFHSRERVDFIRSLPCEVTGFEGQSHNAHTKSRGSGGTFEHICPMSFRAHRDFDEMPAAVFEKKYQRTKQSVRDRAEYYHQLWEGQKG